MSSRGGVNGNYGKVKSVKQSECFSMSNRCVVHVIIFMLFDK